MLQLNFSFNNKKYMFFYKYTYNQDIIKFLIHSILIIHVFTIFIIYITRDEEKV
jgi:hypothetical protein